MKPEFLFYYHLQGYSDPAPFSIRGDYFLIERAGCPAAIAPACRL
jgi:hypothetical protein